MVRSHDLLILSDVEFLSTVSEYFQGIFDPKALEGLRAAIGEGQGETDFEDTVVVSNGKAIEPAPAGKAIEATPILESAGKGGAVVAKKPLPKLKCQLSISNFRVAVIEDVYTEQPQALSLNVSGWELVWACMKKPQALSVNVSG